MTGSVMVASDKSGKCGGVSVSCGQMSSSNTDNDDPISWSEPFFHGTANFEKNNNKTAG